MFAMNQKNHIPWTRDSLLWRRLDATTFVSSCVLVIGLGSSLAEGLVGQGARRVQAVAAKIQRVVYESRLQAEVLPLETMRLVPRVTGYIEKIHVAEGDSVGPDQKLVSLSCPDLLREQEVANALVEKARALEAVAAAAVKAALEFKKVADADKAAATSAVAVAKNAVEVTEADHTRVQNLQESGAATDEVWEQAQLSHSRSLSELVAAQSGQLASQARIGAAAATVALHQAEHLRAVAGVAVAAAQAAQAQVFVDFATLANPYPKARITRQLVDAGTLALADQTAILEVMNVSRVRIRFGVPMVEAPHVRAGSAVTLTRPGGATTAATVTRVTGALMMESRAMWAEVVLDNPDGTWLPRALIKVALTVEVVEQALLIPARAQVKSGNSVRVWVAEAGKARLVEIAVDPRQVRMNDPREGTWVQVRRGIDGGDEVIVAGSIGLDEGEPVDVVLVKR